jgi:hypothetical protein
MAHEVAVETTTRVVMKAGDEVTLREWAVDGKFMYHVNTEEVVMDCLEASDEPFKNEYYQQVSLKANKPDCRWSYVLIRNVPTGDDSTNVPTGDDSTNVPTGDASTPINGIIFEFIVMPER